MLQLSLQQKYFDDIKSGIKTAEGRCNSSKFENIVVGDQISFVCVQTQAVMVKTVTAINFYRNFKDMLVHEGVQNMLPGVTTIEQGVVIYESFPGYKDKVVQVGAIAISIKAY